MVVTYSDEMEASGTELLIDSITLENRNQMEISILGREVTQDADGVTEILLTVNAGNDVDRSADQRRNLLSRDSISCT